jgi:hypothetical protein
LIVVSAMAAFAAITPAGVAGEDDATRVSARRPVTSEVALRRAWSDPMRRRIDLGTDIVLRDCASGDPLRESPFPLLLHGHGHTLRQTCFEQRVLRQDGTGYLELRDVTLTRGGSDGPGAALATRGELLFVGGAVTKNLAEEPGGGLFSMRGITVRRSHINGNLANDDGGGVYARRGGVEIYDSVLSNNLVDGSGGAVGSTGDILVVRSQVDGNTTDGDGGALYADEDGDVTVIRSLIDGSTADGPGGAIFTLDGDVAVLDSSLIGNRADDRGGAVAGEADVLIVNSTVARNLAVAHAGGGVWARGDLVLINATVTDNYAEGEGGGALAAGRLTVLGSTVTANIASVAANIGSAGMLRAFGSIIGPATVDETTGDTRPTRRSCRVYHAESAGYNFLTDRSCELAHATDIMGSDPKLRRLEDDPKGFVLSPFDDSPVRARIPPDQCILTWPTPLAAGRLLARFVDWDAVRARDATGTSRVRGVPCDIGAVQSPLPPAEPLPTAPLAIASGSPAPRRPPVGVRASQRRRAAGVAGPLRRLARRLRVLDRHSRRFDTLLACTSEVPTAQAGDPRHRWGFDYDERDGTGLDRRTALVPARAGAGPQLRLLRLARRPRCLSATPDPNGTAHAAAARDVTPRALERIAVRVERRTERFDDWESCLTWLPVTEFGDGDQHLGFRRGGGYDAGIDVDTSEWDDPDYQLAAFVGRDRPFTARECDTEPGEGAFRLRPRARARSAAAASRGRGRGRGRLNRLRERVDDLQEPVAEITRFDECLYTVGVRVRRGYLYERRGGHRVRRAAFTFDMHGHAPARLDLLAFPGEEPPQIECNEDAGGEGTEE